MISTISTLSTEVEKVEMVDRVERGLGRRSNQDPVVEFFDTP
jgi:hypothetical protein